MRKLILIFARTAKLIALCCLCGVSLLILIFILLFFIGNGYDYDDSKPTDFFKIEEGWEDEAHKNKFEVFVLSNPPNDSSLLKKIVEEYNLRTMSVDTIKKYLTNERVFFHETECLTRNYEEGKPYPEGKGCYYFGDDPRQQIRNHYYEEEKIMVTEYVSYSGGHWEYSYKFGNTDYKDIKIKDIDQFFEEGRKKLNE